ncbi:Holliday junction branch migration protein RuvA [Candidatus Saccharibacteria bacterium]|nr:Holliday junction branch migration protein RuvA [Candidatus Saccharibacteria bacterium]
MIAHVRGKITEKFANSVIVDVNGVGYELSLSALDFEDSKLDTEIKYYTYHAVRENSEELYGFSSLAAKKMFEMLISVNGIGPKAAMAILSLGSAEDVRNAIANADTAYVSKASGVGKKSAERVIVDLRDKVGIPSHIGASEPISLAGASAAPDEALDALMALGFSLKEATEALATVDDNLDVGERVRLALKARSA